MKKALLILLLSAAALSALSCRFAGAQSPMPAANQLSWEQLLYKDDLGEFERAVFSPDGERFLISDDFNYIRLWKKPFKAPAREFGIKGYGAVTNLKFFGTQPDIFFTDEDGLVQIWDKELQNKIFEFHFPYNAKQAAITEDGRFIAADGELYDRQKMSLVGRGVAHAVESAVCFGGAGLLLTAGYHDGHIAVRNIYSGEFEYRQASDRISGAGVSPNGKYAVAITEGGRCHLWNWPDREPRTLAINRESNLFAGFSPDSKWFVVDGAEFLHIFRTNPAERIARLRPDVPFTSVWIASNNLIVMGDKEGYVHIYDVSAGRMIGRHKVCEHAVDPVLLTVGKGYLWAASCVYNSDKGKSEKGEITLYRVEGLEPHIEQGPAAR